MYTKLCNYKEKIIVDAWFKTHVYAINEIIRTDLATSMEFLFILNHIDMYINNWNNNEFLKN